MKTSSALVLAAFAADARALGRWFILAVAGLLAASAGAQVTITATGVVTGTSTNSATVPAGIHAGDAVTTTITFATPSTSGSGSFLFSAADFSFQTTIGSTTWTSASSYENAVSLTNDAVGGASPGDRFAITVSLSGTPATFPGALGTSLLSLILLDTSSTYDLLQGTSLPVSAGDVTFAAATSRDGMIASTTGPGSAWSITYAINSFNLSAAAVPEPASTGLLGAMGALAFGIWRERAKARFRNG